MNKMKQTKRDLALAKDVAIETVSSKDKCKPSIKFISLAWKAKMTASNAVANIACNVMTQKIALVHRDSPN